MMSFNRAFTRSLLLVCSLLLIPSYTFALKESRLWLPKKHKSSMPQLIQAATLAEKNPECVEVLNGQMDRRRSKKAKALVFRIDCRNTHGLSFSLVANADSMDGISRLSAGIKKNAHKVKPIEALKGWEICRIEINKSLKKMINPVLLEVPTPKPYITDVGESLFYVDFDAETVEGYPVFFVSICKVLPSGRKSVEVKPRKLVVKPQGFDVKRKAKTAMQKTRKTIVSTTTTTTTKKDDRTVENSKAQGKVVQEKRISKTFNSAEKKAKKHNKHVVTHSKNVTTQNKKVITSPIDDGWEEVKEVEMVTKSDAVIESKNLTETKVTTDEDGWEVTEGK